MGNSRKFNWRIFAKIIIWLIVLLLIILIGIWLWLQHREKRLIEERTQVLCDTTCLRSGDLMFRNGLGPESFAVTTASNSDYSHVGIAYHMPSGWHVIHAVPGEAAAGEPEYLKCEPIAEFYDPTRAMAGATARINCSDATALNAAKAALKKVEQKVVFDNSYDHSDTTQIYCSELVWMAYKTQGIDLSQQHKDASTLYPEMMWTAPQVQSRKKFETSNNK